MSPLFTLDGSVAVVTGAGRGNGRAIAGGLVDAGARVIGVDLIFDGDSSTCAQVVGDVGKSETIAAAVAAVRALNFSHLILVNNAGVTYPVEGPYPEELWRKTLEVNLTAPFLWVEALAETFRQKGAGSIINITSLGAERAFPNNPAYIAAKGGLKMLSKYYAKALGASGVRVNNVGPGYMVTDMTRQSYDDPEKRAGRERHTFLGRWGQPEDLAGVCVFLASPASAYITGQDIYVDGGWTANGLVL